MLTYLAFMSGLLPPWFMVPVIAHGLAFGGPPLFWLAAHRWQSRAAGWIGQPNAELVFGVAVTLACGAGALLNAMAVAVALTSPHLATRYYGLAVADAVLDIRASSIVDAAMQVLVSALIPLLAVISPFLLPLLNCRRRLLGWAWPTRTEGAAWAALAALYALSCLVLPPLLSAAVLATAGTAVALAALVIRRLTGRPLDKPEPLPSLPLAWDRRVVYLSAMTTLPDTVPVVDATPAAIVDAGTLLRAGRLVAFPTETVYGLGADATNDRAVAAIFEAKGRPSFNPLIVHVAEPAALEPLVVVDDRARAIMARFWPGPLTLVLPRRADSPISLLASAGLDTIAVRLPDHAVAQAVIRASGRPIAAPSANRSGAVSPTLAAHVAESLGARVGLILDGGPCRVGVESTVLDLSGAAPALLRPGGVPVEALEAALGCRLIRPTDHADAPKSPGMLASHYAPGLPVRLNVTAPLAGEAVLGLGAMDCTLNLSPGGDLEEAAANLFAMLRALDRPEFSAIAVAPIPDHGLGLAINDRLKRAAAPRIPA